MRPMDQVWMAKPASKRIFFETQVTCQSSNENVCVALELLSDGQASGLSIGKWEQRNMN